MKFKRAENNLIWEAYGNPSFTDPYDDGKVSYLPDWVHQVDKTSLIVGTYWWAIENHAGEGSDGYRALSMLGTLFNPGRMSRGVEEGTEEEMVYSQIQDESEALAIAEYVFEDEGSEEDAEAVISLEPMGELDVEEVPEEEGLFDDEISEDDDLDNEIIVKSLRKIVKRAGILLQHCEAQSMDTWMIAKIIKAEDYISDVWEELDDVADFANDGPEEDALAL